MQTSDRAVVNVYSVCMVRVNITLPDDLHRRARERDLNVSGVAQRAIAHELERLEKIAALDEYLDVLDEELGPVTDAERSEAAAWADRVFGASGDRRSG